MTVVDSVNRREGLICIIQQAHSMCYIPCTVLCERNEAYENEMLYYIRSLLIMT